MSSGHGGGTTEEQQLYWAKGTGFGTGSTASGWDVEQALTKQRLEEEHVTCLLQVTLTDSLTLQPKNANPFLATANFNVVLALLDLEHEFGHQLI